MSDKKKDRIAGRAWNTIRHLKKLIEEATEDFTKWQRGLFDPGQPLEKFYPDQINLRTGAEFEFGAPGEKPIGRIDIAIVREAIRRETAINDLATELAKALETCARKLSIVRGETYYASQINQETGEITETKSANLVELDLDEDDDDTQKRADEEGTRKSKLLSLGDEDDS